MRNVFVIVFRTERAAFEGLFELEHLDARGEITLHEAAAIERRPDGTIVPRYSRTNEPPLRRPGIGALVGAVSGLPAGPAGAIVGVAVGVLGGAIDDAIRSGADEDGIRQIAEHMEPGTFVVVADVHENENSPLISRMEELGGRVLCVPRKGFVENLLEKPRDWRPAAR